MTDVVAPSLSTYQDDNTFTYEKYQEKQKDRSYLGPNWNDAHSLRDKLVEYYSLDELVEFLGQRLDDGLFKFKKITLQFPDSLVADAAIVVQLLQEKLKELEYQKPEAQDSHHDDHSPKEKDHHGKKSDCKRECSGCKCSDPLNVSKKEQNAQQVWILADTAYSPCCIDEVAAEHVLSDIVVHFGDACMNAIQKLPAVYVFGKPYLDLDIVVDRFKETYPDTDSKVVLMADTSYSRHLASLFEILKHTYKDIAYADISPERASGAKIIGFQSTKQKGSIRFSNRKLIFASNNDPEDEELQDYSLFHISIPQAPHLLYLSTKFGSVTLFDTADNSINQGPFPSLMKRYRYMHIARTAGTIGILVNTLSLRNTTEVIKKVSAKIKEAEKKYYMFVVGKPNVAKLANFESIDVWCILGCGQGGIVLDNNNEFFKPIITPYELGMALSPEVQWTGKWVTEFENVMKEDENNETEASTSMDDTNSPTLEGEDDAPEFNPVTGKYVSTSRPLRQIQHLEIDSVDSSGTEENQLVKKFSQAVAIKGTVSTSAIHLQNREWTGLGSDFINDGVDDEGALVEEGRGGIARGYDYDVNNGY